MTRRYTFRPGERERRAENMRRLNADPLFADRQQKRSSARTKALHAAYQRMRAWAREAA